MLRFDNCGIAQAVHVHVLRMCSSVQSVKSRKRFFRDEYVHVDTVHVISSCLEVPAGLAQGMLWRIGAMLLQCSCDM